MAKKVFNHILLVFYFKKLKKIKSQTFLSTAAYLGIRRQKFAPTDKTQLYGSQKYIVLIHQVVYTWDGD